MGMDAILFDLDDTLIVDEAVSRESMESTARQAAVESGVEARRFFTDASRHGSQLWKEGPCHAYVRSIGISYHECLWGKFEGDTPELASLREWATAYRVEVFRKALQDQGLPDQDLAESLAGHFSARRRALQRLMPDAKEVLTRLRQNHKLALLTNGAPDLQREKIAASGLGGFFDAIAVSGEHGIGKPQPGIFQILLDQLGVEARRAVMVGNSLERDIAGARNARLAAAIWIQIEGSEEPADVVPHHTIRGLHELPPLIATLG